MAALKLYSELAHWWPLFSPPGEYVEEAEFFLPLLLDSRAPQPRTLVEFGSGAGSTAFHLKPHFRLTLVDLSPEMLAVSRAVNPECEHLPGDMRTVRLGRQFDVVFIHDAIDYMTTSGDLRRALETAFVHCKPGGVALLAPDHVREIFRPSTEHGGLDGDARGLRYLLWQFDPDPSDNTYLVHFAFLLRDGDVVHAEHDSHVCGLFDRAEWLRLLRSVGFQAQVVPDPFERELFLATRPAT
jgi:SAM-dependent methyltransferase